MSNPTSNYAFQMPTNTDLVYQLPADFEVFGQAVDTQMKTNADAATQKATLTTKGDLYAASAASTPARLGVGTNGQVLTADSTAATGLAWANPSSGSLTLISTTTMTAVSNQAITGIFSSTYQNYLVYVQATLSASTALLFQMRSGGTSANTNYRMQRFMSSSTTNSSDRDADTSNFNTMYNAMTTCNGTVTLFRPFEAAQTGAIFEWTGQETTNSYILKGSGFHTTATSYDGLTVYPGSGTVSGIIRVYGVKN